MAYKVEKFGDHRERRSFSKIKNTFALTDLLEIQKKSYQRFLEVGIKETFEDLFPIESFTGNISLELGDYYFEEPRYTVKEDFGFQKGLKTLNDIENKVKDTNSKIAKLEHEKKEENKKQIEELKTK